jgi:5-formyltetrahydrofolate cyclo-ligase
MNDLRKTAKVKRELLTKDEVSSLSNAVFNNLKTLDFLWEKSNFFVYNSFRNEVETSKIISHLLSLNKTVAHPITIESNMVAGIPLTSEFVSDKFGVSTPKDYAVLDSVDVAIIPLLLCDKNKNRLGYGKGFYDRFLSTHPCLKVGVCYDFQVLENLTPNPWDIPLDIIVTPTKIIK